MNVRDLIKELQGFNPDALVVLGSDEELNTIYADLDIAYLGEKGENSKVVIWGNPGSEMDE